MDEKIPESVHDMFAQAMQQHAKMQAQRETSGDRPVEKNFKGPMWDARVGRVQLACWMGEYGKYFTIAKRKKDMKTGKWEDSNQYSYSDLLCALDCIAQARRRYVQED